MRTCFILPSPRLQGDGLLPGSLSSNAKNQLKMLGHHPAQSKNPFPPGLSPEPEGGWVVDEKATDDMHTRRTYPNVRVPRQSRICAYAFYTGISVITRWWAAAWQPQFKCKESTKNAWISPSPTTPYHQQSSQLLRSRAHLQWPSPGHIWALLAQAEKIARHAATDIAWKAWKKHWKA